MVFHVCSCPEPPKPNKTIWFFMLSLLLGTFLQAKVQAKLQASHPPAGQAPCQDEVSLVALVLVRPKLTPQR